MVTEFTFVRHGETDANLNGILQGGNSDIPLNSVGREQARVAAGYLRGAVFDAAFCSDLSRAVETAREILALHPGVALHPAPQLREWDCGEMAGLSWAEIKRRFPEESRAFFIENSTAAMPGGESRGEFQRRVDDFLRRLVREYPGKKILLVSHGGVLQRIFRFVTGMVADGNLIPLAGNASVSTFLHRDDYDAWQLTSWNRNDHLKGLPQHQTRVL